MMVQLSKERKEAYVEVLEVLKHMDKTYVDKIPIKLINFFEDNCSIEYKFVLDKKVEEKELKRETLNLLAMLNLNYWCEDETHKQELLNKYYQNEIKMQEELLEKYKYNNLFKVQKEEVSNDNTVKDESTALIKNKESFIRKIINKIKRKIIFRKYSHKK